MASFLVSKTTVLLLVLVSLAQVNMGSRVLSSLVEQPSELLTYHNGAVLQGDIAISIMWYGAFTPTQKSIISDFLLSLTPSSQTRPQPLTPSVPQWWETIDKVYLAKAGKETKTTNIVLAEQVSDEECSLGKSLKTSQIPELAARAGPKKGGIALVFTAQDVAVEGFCMSRCGLHGSDRNTGSAYIWVGNSAEQCPGRCAWPFHQPMYGPQTPPLVAPNGDVGVDGMVINLATLVAGTVTNPFGYPYLAGLLLFLVVSLAAAHLSCLRPCPLPWSSRRRCGNPRCRGLKKALEFDVQLQTEECIRSPDPAQSAAWKEIDDLPWKGGQQGNNPDYECLRAELRRMAPPNGRAVLLFRSRCGCPLAKLEAWGPKRGRRHKKVPANLAIEGGDR